MALSRITEAVASFTDLTIGDDLTLTDDLLMASDANIIKFGADADVTLTHVHNTGLLLNSTSVIQFNDASQNIGAPSATVLDINATDEIELNATLIDVNGNLDVSGTIVAAGALTAATSITVGSAALTEAELEFLDGITAGTAAASKALILDGSTNITGIGTIGSGAITSSSTIQGTTITATTAFVPDASDGAALGTSSLEFSDLFLADGAVINFGDDQDVGLSHVADTGLLLNSSRKLQFSDAAESVHSDGSKLILTSNSVAFSLPTADGSSGQVLQTNGSGVLSFSTISANTPSSADGQALGSASLEWSDLFLADGGQVLFGNDQEITLTHDADVGLKLKHTATADDKPIVLTLQTGETDMAANDVMGAIRFQAPDEGTGTDAILVAAAIQAVSEGDFSASSNATRLEFHTGASEAASSKMTLSSAGLLTIADDLIIKDGGTIGVTSDADAITIASNGQLTLTQTLIGTALDISGDIDVDGTTNLDVVDIDGAVDMASTLQVDGAITSSAGATITTADNTAQLTLTSTDGDDSSGPKLELIRNSGSAANGDNIGAIIFKAADAAGNTPESVIQFLGVLEDSANGAEDASLDIRTIVAGNTRSRIDMEASETVFNNESIDLDFRVESDGDANMIFVDAGNNKVGIKDSAPVGIVSIKGGDSGVTAATSYSNELVIENNTNGGITFNCGASNSSTILFQNSSNAEDGQIAYRNSEREMRFNVAGAEKFRIQGDGNVLVGTTTTNIGTSGAVFYGGSSVGVGQFSATNMTVMYVNRSNDGRLFDLRSAGTLEGEIGISGSTTTYGAFTGTHWSRLTDNTKPTILLGTVIETIDEMCDWYQVKFTIAATTEINVHDKTVESTPEAVCFESIALPSGKSVGDTISYTHKGITYDDAVIIKEDDDKHTKCKISDTADSKSVYGVFCAWDADDDNVNDMKVASLGTHVVRINKDVTVSKGDLLVSNGDGTAKVQDDDIIRSKTIGKVLTNIKQETYSDESYTVPCALYCG